ncbi:hypothetical protein DPMN_171040 [Dreissena polymorpha]|uniref:Uncharacterized protein n=1 Tax=Dreissena polymorpha TaxID=45954 RepID=A0A9D4DZP0_DREPO|nr:hypothetical protein DPMN_171010 [Dreissena polymorpha]KAH3769764.1 hypothetical protein DPMN_171040 [Dreissena polymorpha]
MGLLSYAASEATDQPALTRAMARSYAVLSKVTQGFVVTLADRIALDQTVRLHRLVWSCAFCIWLWNYFHRSRHKICQNWLLVNRSSTIAK